MKNVLLTKHFHKRHLVIITIIFILNSLLSSRSQTSCYDGDLFNILIIICSTHYPKNVMWGK